MRQGMPAVWLATAALLCSLALTSAAEGDVTSSSNALADAVVKPTMDMIPRVNFGMQAFDREQLVVGFYRYLFKGDMEFAQTCFGGPSTKETPECGYIQNAVLTIAVTLVCLVLTMFSSFVFCLGRGCRKCHCCCSNCGGRGVSRAYTPGSSKIWVAAFVVILLLMGLFTAIGVLSQMQVRQDIPNVLEAALRFFDIPSIYLNTQFRPAVSQINNLVKNSFDQTAATFANLTLYQSILANVSAQSYRLASEFKDAYVTDSRTNITRYTVLYAAISETSERTAGVSGGSLGDTMNSTRFQSQIQLATNSFEVQLQTLVDSMKSLKDSADPVQNQIDMLPEPNVFALPPWILAVLVLLCGVVALILRRGKMWWCQWCWTPLIVWIFWVLFVVFYIIFYPLSDICLILPEDNADTWVKTANTAELRGFGEECLAKDGDIFKAMGVDVRSEVDKVVQTFNVSASIPASTRDKIFSVADFASNFSSVASQFKNLATVDVYTDAEAGSSSAFNSNGKADRIRKLARELDANIVKLNSIASAAKNDMANIGPLLEPALNGVGPITDLVTSCSSVYNVYQPFRKAFCGGLVSNMVAIYFALWGVAACLVLQQFLAMKLRKRWTKDKPAGNAKGSRQGGARAKGGKKSRVTPA